MVSLVGGTFFPMVSVECRSGSGVWSFHGSVDVAFKVCIVVVSVGLKQNGTWFRPYDPWMIFNSA